MGNIGRENATYEVLETPETTTELVEPVEADSAAEDVQASTSN